MGYLYVYDVETTALIYTNHTTTDTVLITAPPTTTSGLIGVTKSGNVFIVSINERTFASYLADEYLAAKISVRANLQGADELYLTQFQKLIQTGQVQQAVELAADSPRGILRTPQTMQMLQSLPILPDSRNPLSCYFQYY